MHFTSQWFLEAIRNRPAVATRHPALQLDLPLQSRLKEMAQAFEHGDIMQLDNMAEFGLTGANRTVVLRMFQEQGFIGDVVHTASGQFSQYSIRSSTVQAVRAIEDREKRNQEMLRLQQEQRQHDREWEAAQEDKARAWQAEQEKIRHQREDRRDKINWILAGFAIASGLGGVFLGSVLSKSDPPVVHIDPIVVPAPDVNVAPPQVIVNVPEQKK